MAVVLICRDFPQTPTHILCYGSATQIDMENVLGSLQGDVQRKLGYCILRLQQYEGLLKSMMAASMSFEGTFEELSSATVQSKTIDRNKTLGTLMNAFISDHLTSQPPSAAPRTPKPHQFAVNLRYAISMSPESLDEVETELRALVSLRNELVHHYLERFNVFTEDGCRKAIDHLDVCYESIETNLNRLKSWAAKWEEARVLFVAAMQSEEFENALLREPSARRRN